MSAPVSINRMQAPTFGPPPPLAFGVKVPAGAMRTLRRGPIVGLKLAERHGMREEPKIYGVARDFLDGIEAIWKLGLGID